MLCHTWKIKKPGGTTEHLTGKKEIKIINFNFDRINLLKIDVNFTNILDFNNQLLLPSATTSFGTSFYTTSFTYQGSIIASFKDNLISGSLGKIVLYNETTKNKILDVGTINYDTGEVYIDKQYLPGNIITGTVIPRNPQLLTSKLNTIFTLNATVTK